MKAEDIFFIRSNEQLSPPKLDHPRKLIAQAQADFNALEPYAAQKKLLQAEKYLKNYLDFSAAVNMLANVLRLRGLTELFLEKNEKA